MSLHAHIYSLILAALVSPSPSSADTLTNEALYYRCYAQLTQSRPPYNDPRTAEVRNGKNAITACMEVFDSARLTNNGNTRINNVNNTEAKAVIHQMHRLHSSWLTIKDYPTTTSTPSILGAKDMTDVTSPAFYYTRALFSPASTANSIVTGFDNLEALRTDQNPSVGAASGIQANRYLFGNQTVLAPRGDLLGIRVTGNRNKNYNYVVGSGNNRRTVSGTLNVTHHMGGGLMGSPAFRLLNVNEGSNFRSDGAMEMPRKWARAVFSDLLCRELPVIRPVDAMGFVNNAQNSVAFRKDGACVRCHASMDRAASTLRNFRYFNTGIGGMGQANNRIALFASAFTPNRNANNEWPARAENNYHLSNPRGVLYFRNYLGQLVNINVNNLDQLGQRIAEQDDFHICTAKRYYRYFTGIDVSIEDPNGEVFEGAQKFYRDKVIELGIALKNHQDPRVLVRDILRSSEYRQSDFGLRSLASE